MSREKLDYVIRLHYIIIIIIIIFNNSRDFLNTK